jgi:beta-galactosidase
MVNRRTFVGAATLFPILTACGGSSNSNPATPSNPGAGAARFTAATNNGFLLAGKPFFMAAGELHPGRIPYQYWDQRIKMVKSMGFNTVSMYDFWNIHETDFDPAVGPRFDFATDERNLPRFRDLCMSNNMWVFLRPGPFIAAFWDMGGIPAYLLKNDGIVLRSSTDAIYMDAVERYIKAITPVITPRLSCNGGPIIMVQVENEYTSIGRDKNYLKAVRNIWQKNGIGVNGNVVLATNNGFIGDTVYSPETALTDMPIGGDPLLFGEAADAYAKYHQPIFGSEIYSGWDSHSSSSSMYGDGDAPYNAKQLAAYIKGLLLEQTSFAIYVACGGTSFEYGASGVYDLKKFTFATNVTSYDYRGPINEQGSRAVNLYDAKGNVTTSSYDATKAEFASALAVSGTAYSLKGPLDAVGAAASTTAIPAAPASTPMIALAASSMPLTSLASIWDNLPAPIASTTGPLPCERVGMYSGCGIVYQTTTPDISGIQYMTIERLSDVATVFVNGTLTTIIDRRPNTGRPTGTVVYADTVSAARSVVKIDFGTTTQKALIEIFVYTFGHAGDTSENWDTFRKGMWRSVFLAADKLPSSTKTALPNWNMYPLPMPSSYVSSLKSFGSTSLNRPGKFFSASFNLAAVGDAYLDLSTWNLGAVWVNGHNLGRHSASVGPQTRWYCPGTWLNAGSNQLVIFDNYITDATQMRVALLDTPSVYQNIVLISGKKYTVMGNASGKFLGTVAGNTSIGTLLEVAAASGGLEQRWTATDVAGRWQLKNVKSGTLLDVPAESIAEGTLLDIAAGTETFNQVFNLLARPDAHSFGIKGQQSGLVLTDTVSGLASLPAITQSMDYANPNQCWTFVPV